MWQQFDSYFVGTVFYFEVLRLFPNLQRQILAKHFRRETENFADNLFMDLVC